MARSGEAVLYLLALVVISMDLTSGQQKDDGIKCLANCDLPCREYVSVCPPITFRGCDIIAYMVRYYSSTRCRSRSTCPGRDCLCCWEPCMSYTMCRKAVPAYYGKRCPGPLFDFFFEGPEESEDVADQSGSGDGSGGDDAADDDDEP